VTLWRCWQSGAVANVPCQQVGNSDLTFGLALGIGLGLLLALEFEFGNFAIAPGNSHPNFGLSEKNKREEK